MESTHTHGTGFLGRATAALLPAESLSKWLSAAGMSVFMLMVFLTFVDVFLRYWFGKSINGTVEITELMMVIVVFSSTAYTQWQKSHVTMDILTSKLTEPRRALLAVATTLWSLATIGFCSYTTARYAASTSSVTLVLRIPLTPFIGLASFGFALLAVTLLHDLLKALSEACRRAGNRQAVLALCLGCLPMLGAWWVATHKLPGMGSVAVGVLGLVFLFALFFLGMPVAFALMATGLVFIANLRGVSAGFTTLGKSMYATASSYAWSPLMFFMLMGYLCFHARFGEDIYGCARKWLGHLRGGLAVGSVAACALFGAVVGDVLAGSIAMAAIALPEMRKHGYNDELAVGTLACSGTIGCLIPPSTTFIIYGVLAQQSIGDLFVAGIIPGLLCALCFMAAVWLMVFLKPGLAPRLPKSPLHERMASLKTGLPIMGIFFLVIGGIYGGVFTATEGGGIGAFGTLLLALCHAPHEPEKLHRHPAQFGQVHLHVLHRPVRGHRAQLLHGHDAHPDGTRQQHRRAGRRPHAGPVRHRHDLLHPRLFPAVHAAAAHLRADLRAHCEGFRLGSDLVRRHHHGSGQHGLHHAAFRHQPLRHEGSGGRDARRHVPLRRSFRHRPVRLPSPDCPVPPAGNLSPHAHERLAYGGPA